MQEFLFIGKSKTIKIHYIFIYFAYLNHPFSEANIFMKHILSILP
jgi:hypothetical protein